MAALDFTLNQMTMLALTLMVGIVIDDAIVVLENIYRFVEEKGMTPFQAAIEGTREIGLAVMATTLSLLAVFVPVGFLGGIVGRFMSSFGLTSAAAIAISLIVSFTLTPMLAARWIKHDHDDAGRATSRGAASTATSTAPTPRMLTFSMAHRWVIVGVCALVIASMVPAVPDVGRQLHARRGRVAVPGHRCGCRSDRAWRRRSRCSIGSRATCASSCRACPTRWRSPGGGGGGFGQTNAGSVFVRLKPIDEREFSQQELIVARAPPDAAVPAVGGDLDPGRRRPGGHQRPRRADSVRAGRPGSAEARRVHGSGRGRC